MGDYDDERPSWRDLDRRKDRSRHYGRQEKTQEKGQKKEGPKDRWQEGRVKEALDRLFMGKKGTVEHDKLYRKVHDSYGSQGFLVNVKKYIENYGLPDDASTLILILDTKEQDIIIQTLGKIKKVYAALSDRQKEDVKRKLSIIAITDRSKEVKSKAEEVMREINQEMSVFDPFGII